MEREGIYKGLPGKVALVTGASSGLGRQFALSLARHGCNVVAAARRKDMLSSLCNEINSMNSDVRAEAIELDVTESTSTIDLAVSEAWSFFGFIDILVNNAGFRGNVVSPIELKEEEWDKTVKTNMKSCWMVSKAVSKRMCNNTVKGGSIVNISSIGGLQRGELPGGTAYIASKAALNALTKSMALELGPYNIRVNAVAPGLFRSEITAGLMEKDWLANVANKIVPLQTWGDVDPCLTSAILFLSSDSSSYITGNVFIVDGGQSIPGIPLYSSL